MNCKENIQSAILPRKQEFFQTMGLLQNKKGMRTSPFLIYSLIPDFIFLLHQVSLL
jgi:hypothetical protein